MAIPEACGVWIEQRVQEELERKGETGASLRAIGRQVAAEVEKYFETKVDPNTIYQRTRRQAGTDVPPKSKPPENKQDTTPEIIQDRKPQGGGKRKGAGRKPKSLEKSLGWLELSAKLEGLIGSIEGTVDVMAKMPEWKKARGKILNRLNSIPYYAHAK
jgi:hypothetical protein